MSYSISSTNNSSSVLQNALHSLGNLGTMQSSPFATSVTNGSTSFAKIIPTFKMEMYKSENEGFILNLIKLNPSSYSEEGKLFILNDIENLGRDIQNILMMEIIKK